MAMKWSVLILSLFLSLFLVAGANADIVPIVKLLFDDSNATSTVNLGSLGGVQYLPPTGGSKSTSRPIGFTGTSWYQASAPSGTAYATYTIPEMSAVTVAFWYKSSATGLYRNIYNGNGGPFTASDYNGSLMLYGPGHGQATVSGAFPANRWTHVAISYDSKGPTKVYDISGTLNVYINGQPATVAGSWTGPVAASSVGFTIGEQGGDSSCFIGYLDNFFIFDSALQQTAIQSLKSTNTVPAPTTCEEVKVYGFLSQADLNEDCSVDLKDLAILSENWTLCTDDSDISCNGLDLPWINNTYGSEDVVLPGFEPLTASSSDVSMWGRVYQFDGAVLPTQINNQGINMLARPINWFLKSGSPTYPLTAINSTLVTSSSTKAVYETSGTLGGMNVQGSVLVEYDGFMKFDMVFDPGASPVQADRLYMDIPFVPSCATNMFYPTRRSGAWDDTWHNKFDITYTNIINVGTPEMCLQWLTESDQYYYPRENANTLQTLTVDGARVLRINVIAGTKTITSPFKLTFALHAGPVKARRADWRGWALSPVKYNLDPNLSNLVTWEYDWWDRAPGEPIPRGGFPAEANKNYFKDEIKYVSAHFAGVRSFDETDCDKRSPEWQKHGLEWLRFPTIWEDQGCPGWFNAYVDTNSSWSQWHVYNVYKLFSLTGMRGLYYDDWRNGPSTNEAAGSGYIDEQGVRRPTNPIFSQRELHRRVYAIVHKYRPDDGVVFIHTASTIMLPVASFCDVIYDGEIMIWTDMVPPGGDYFQTYTNSLFQVIYQCRQYGQIPGFHDMTREQLRAYPEIVGPNYLDLSNQRKLWAILLTHDIHMMGAWTSGLENTYLYPWLHSFGMVDPNVVFHPYWDVAPAAKIVAGQEPESHLWSSAYSKPGKVMVIVVRDAPNSYTGSLAIQVELDRTKLGLPAGNLICTSLESLGTTPLGTVVGNILTVPVEANNFAGVIIEPE